MKERGKKLDKSKKKKSQDIKNNIWVLILSFFKKKLKSFVISDTFASLFRYYLT